MSRPLLNLSILELTDKFEASAGMLNTALDLMNELRHRTTPKANALHKRVMAVIAKSASSTVLQSLHLPELEALATACGDNPRLKEALIGVLQTRNSAKAQRLLTQLGGTGKLPKAEMPVEPLLAHDKVDAQDVLQYKPSVPGHPATQKPALISPATTVPLISAPLSVAPTSRIPPDVEQAFMLFGVSTDSTWREIEDARQKLVFKYRPDSNVEKGLARAALTQIADAHILLAKFMRSKH